jgi:hypothetical protein
MTKSVDEMTLGESLDALGSAIHRLVEALTELYAELEKGSGTWPAVWPTRKIRRFYMRLAIAALVRLIQKMEPYCPVHIQDEARAILRAVEEA